MNTYLLFYKKINKVIYFGILSNTCNLCDIITYIGDDIINDLENLHLQYKHYIIDNSNIYVCEVTNQDVSVLDTNMKYYKFQWVKDNIILNYPKIGKLMRTNSIYKIMHNISLQQKLFNIVSQHTRVAQST